MSKDLTNGPNFGQIDKYPDIFWTRVSDTEETTQFFYDDMSKTITVSEISTIMGKLLRLFLGQIGRFLSLVPISE
jgi:hypothetical protein